jgi:tight adherence protein C
LIGETQMLWTVTFGTFLATLAVCIALYYGFASGKSEIADRVSRLGDTPGTESPDAFAEKQAERVRDVLASVGKLVPGGAQSRSVLMMTRAGYRSPTAILVVRGLKILLPIALLAGVYFTGFYEANPILIVAGALLAGFLLPEIWILVRVNGRQARLRRGLPDALDLLVICVEAGLGLDQALLRVTQELKVVHPELSDELQLVNMEMRVGKSRIDALRELARRTGVEDVKALVAMLAQTERFGTSIASSLRVHSDDLRTRRRQRAEEMSAKTSVKMVPVLVLFIFPALMVVILGPAILILLRQFINVR